MSSLIDKACNYFSFFFEKISSEKFTQVATFSFGFSESFALRRRFHNGAGAELFDAAIIGGAYAAAGTFIHSRLPEGMRWLVPVTFVAATLHFIMNEKKSFPPQIPEPTHMMFSVPLENGEDNSHGV